MSICLEYQSVQVKSETWNLAAVQILVALALLIVLLAKIWIKVGVTDLGYQLAREKRATVEYDMQIRELELQRSFLLRRDNLAAAAQQKLGMRPVHAGQIVKVQY